MRGERREGDRAPCEPQREEAAAGLARGQPAWAPRAQPTVFLGGSRRRGARLYSLPRTGEFRCAKTSKQLGRVKRGTSPTGRRELTPLGHWQARCPQEDRRPLGTREEGSPRRWSLAAPDVRPPGAAGSAQLGDSTGDVVAGCPAQPEGSHFVTNKQTNKGHILFFNPKASATLSARGLRDSLAWVGCQAPLQGRPGRPVVLGRASPVGV